MAYYAALVSLVELLKEINNPEHPYSKSLFQNDQIQSLYNKLTHLQELLKKYSPNLVKEAADLGMRIRDTAYEAQDIIESHITDLVPRQILVEGSEKPTPDDIVGIKYYEGLKLNKVLFEVDDIVVQLTGRHGHGHAHEHEHEHEHADEDELHMAVLGELCGGSSRREVISIVGMGGLGKTNLARRIFYSKLIYSHFDCTLWVTVSQVYHKRDILLAIIDSLHINKKELREAGEPVLESHIYKHLFGRRCLVIMDDMWDKNVWDDIKRILPNNNDGSRIMITTRESDVAFYATTSGFCHKMPFLDEYRSWNLFCEKVFCPPELEDIGRLIAKNCQGLPLSIVVVAGLLSKVYGDRHQWEEIARNTASYTIHDEDSAKILLLSYKNLPHHLKPCFLYLGGFPKNYEIPTSTLIRLWAAEGFLKPHTYKTLEEIGEEYLGDLASRNLVLLTKKRSNRKLKYCVIHAFMKEFCLQRAKYENFLLIHENDVRWNVRRLYIHSSTYFQDANRGWSKWFEGCFSKAMSRVQTPLPTWVCMCYKKIREAKYAPHVRSVLFFGNSWDNIESYMSEFKLLRVFDASSMGLDFFPVEIVELSYLRFLALKCFECHIPPSISKLQNLQTLIICGTGTSSLPSEIWKMPQLRHVIFSEMTLCPIPSGERITDGLPLLEKMQTLCTVIDFTFTQDTVEMIPNLKKLKLRFCNYMLHENAWEKFGLKNLIHLHQLETLNIIFDKFVQDSRSFPESFAFPQNLKILTLKGCNLPWEEMTIVGSLPNLQVLKLECMSFVGEEWESIEGEFLNLKFLRMDGLFDLKYWRTERTHFPCLEQLQIRECKKLEEISLEIGVIPTLQLIEVRSCSPSLESSALEIQEEQMDLGNDELHVLVYRQG